MIFSKYFSLLTYDIYSAWDHMKEGFIFKIYHIGSDYKLYIKSPTF